MSFVEKITLEKRPAVSPELQQEVEQFLYAESELLDDRKFEAWYQLMADDISYQLPVKSNVFVEDQREGHTAGMGGYVMDEDKHRLSVRVRKLMNGRDVIERPYSMMRRMLSNIRITPQQDGTFKVRTCFSITRIRNDYNVDLYTGEREDVLRRTDSNYGWEVAKRVIHLDHTVHRGGGIGFLF